MISFTDIEFIVSLILLALLFITGLRKKEVVTPPKYSGIDFSMSVVLKGIACILILMGHFVNRRIGVVDITHFSRIVYWTTANVALFLFMYFSGYGLSIKKPNCVYGGAFIDVVCTNKESLLSTSFYVYCNNNNICFAARLIYP